MRKIFLVVLLAGLTGCKLDLLSLASPSPAGHYKLDVARTAENMKALAQAEAQKGAGTSQEIQQAVEEQGKKAAAVLATMNMTMTLNEDRTWEGVFGWGPFQRSSKGTWEQKDEKLLLTTLQEDGQPRSQPKVEEAVYKGGDIYFATEAADLSTAFILTRSSQ